MAWAGVVAVRSIRERILKAMHLGQGDDLGLRCSEVDPGEDTESDDRPRDDTLG